MPLPWVRIQHKVVIAILLFPVVINLPELLNVLKADPALLYSWIATNVHGQLLTGLPSIDPNVGFGFQSVGKRAAEELLQGHLPWWNPFEGAGAPLSGEMVSAAFYPLTLLLELPRGEVIVQTLIQAFAGLATFGLLRSLGVARLACAVGALLYEVSGTAAWLGSGWIYGMPCLPLMLLGIEMSRRDVRAQRFQGGLCISAAVAVSVSAGFIEIPFLDGLLGIAWSGVRFLQTPKDRMLRFASHVIGAGIVGTLVALPIIIAFFDYVKVAYVGGHDGTQFSNSHLPIEALTQKLLPYIFGPIFGYASPLVSDIWSNTGGYAGFAVVLLAISSAFGSAQRALKILLAAWVILTLGASFGLPIIHDFVLSWPGVRYTAQYRYFDTSWEFALSMLVAFAIADTMKAPSAQGLRRIWFGAISVVVLGTVCLLVSTPLLQSLWILPQYPRWFLGSLLAPVITLVAIWLCSRTLHGVQRGVALGLIVCCEATIAYVIPTLSHPRSGTTDVSGVQFLQSRIGFQRLYTMGPIVPNYGSYYGVASVNYQDALMANSWVNYVQRRLDPYVSPLLFLGWLNVPQPDAPTREQELLRNINGFEQAGVEYIATSPRNQQLFSFASPVGSGPKVDLPLEVGDSVHIDVSSVSTGWLSGIEILQTNYAGTADGTLTATMCSGTVCTSGRQVLSNSPDNDYLTIPFKRPLLVDSMATSLTLTHSSGHRPIGVWFYGDTPAQAQHSSANGNELSGYGTPVRLTYSAQPYEYPVAHAANVTVDLTPGKRNEIEATGLPAGDVRAFGLFVDNKAGTADGSLQLSACSGGTCTGARRELRESTSTDFFWLKLKNRLPIINGQAMLRFEEVGATHLAAIELAPPIPTYEQRVRIAGQSQTNLSARLQLDYGQSPSPATLLYTNTVMNIYQLHHPRPYLSASNCTVAASSRTTVSTTCAKPSTLRRLELFLPGWSATINGESKPIDSFENTFQQIAIPAGTSAITFNFVPPYMAFGLVAFWFGLAALAIQCGLAFGTFRYQPRVATRESVA